MTTLKRIDAVSVPAVENTLALFDTLPTSVAFNRTHLRELLPTMTITRDGPLMFRLFSDSQFIDFSKTWFYLKSGIEKSTDDGVNWVPLGATDADKKVGVIQNYGSSFIKELKISINGIECYNSGIYYPYKSYISTEFDTPVGQRNAFLQSACYFADEGDKGQESENNDGYKRRKALFANGQKVGTMVRLNFDLANQNSLFLNNSDVLFSIRPQKDEFLLLIPGGIPAAAERAKAVKYRVSIYEAKIYCTLVDVVQSLQNQIAKTLESTPAKYSIRKVELRHLYVPKGTTNIAWNVFGSVIPRRLMVFMVNNPAFDGEITSSPFLFQNSNLEGIWVEANNIIVPNNPYKFDFENARQGGDKNIIRGFIDFYEGMDHVDQEKENGLTLYKYINGWTGWVFPLSATHHDAGDAFELVKNGTTVIKVHFSKAIEDPGLMILALGEFDQVLTVDANRVLSIDGAI
jgi:hypothetical protein